jgi:hypothetical protein
MLAWLIVIMAFIVFIAYGVFWEAVVIGCALFACIVIGGLVLQLFD